MSWLFDKALCEQKCPVNNCNVAVLCHDFDAVQQLSADLRHSALHGITSFLPRHGSSTVAEKVSHVQCS